MKTICTMQVSEIMDIVERIIEEEFGKCPDLEDTILKRISKAIPGAVAKPCKSNMPRIQTSGPKVTDFPKCDPTTIVQFWVLPLFNLEIKRQ